MAINLGSAYGEIVIGTEKSESNIAQLSSSLRNTGAAMSAAFTLPLVGIATAAVTSAAGFEQSMNVMQQVSGATEAQMASLQAQALQLGAETSFSAGEAAGAMLELAKAGLSVDEVSAAIAGTMALAAAGGLDLAQAAEISANAVNAFGLEASEADNVANMLAAAANASSVEVTDLAAGFQMAGSVFASNGQSVSDLATAMAILGNNAIKGSDAGTSLKTMMMRLAAPTEQASAAMQALGLNVYNADGSMRPFGDIVADLSTVTAGLSDEQRNAALSTIFGADAIRSATVLAREGAAGFASMSASVGQQGAAADVANARMSGMAGAIEYMKGSIDSFLIATALPFLDSMGGIVRQAADMLTAFGSLPQPVKDAALAFGAVLAAAGPLMLALSGLGTVLGTLLSPIGLVALAIGGLAAAWVSDFGGIRTTLEPIIAAIVDWFQTQIPAAIGAAQAIFAQLAPKFDELGTAGQTLWSALDPVLSALAAAVGQGLAVAMDAGVNLLAAVFANLEAIVTPVIDQVIANISLIASTVTDVASLVSAIASGDWAAAWAAAEDVVGNFSEFFQSTFENMQSFASALMTTLASAVTSTLEDMGVDVGSALSGLQSTWESVFNSLKAPIDTVIGAVQNLWDKVSGFADWWNGLKLGDPLAAVGDLANQAGGMLGGAGQAIQDAPGAIWDSLTGQGNAEGTSWHRGGLTMVGERGPELALLPPGASVLTNGQSNRRGEPSVVYNNTFQFTGPISSEIDIHQLGYKLASLLEGFGQ